MPAGRPTAYKPEYAEQAEKLCKLGATDFELAEFFGVVEITIRRWKAAHPEFCSALKTGKDVADDRVERSLYAKAVGYSYTSEKLWQYDGEVIRTEIVEHVPPSDTAAIFWLKNRRKDEWRDRREQDHTSSDGSMTPQVVQYALPDNGRDKKERGE